MQITGFVITYGFMKNEIEVVGEVARIRLRRKTGADVFTVIDLACLPRLLELVDNRSLNAQWSSCVKGFYAVGYEGRGALARKRYFLHRFLTDCPVSLQVDHINRDTLDNRLCNLRCVTAKVNMSNWGPATITARGYTWYEERQKWRVKILTKDFRASKWVKTEAEAILARDEMLKEAMRRRSC